MEVTFEVEANIQSEKFDGPSYNGYWIKCIMALSFQSQGKPSMCLLLLNLVLRLPFQKLDSDFKSFLIYFYFYFIFLLHTHTAPLGLQNFLVSDRNCGDQQ